MKIVIGSDHAGFDLKQKIISHFKNIDFKDVGPYDSSSCDYPDYISKVALKVQKKEVNLGIAICGSGIGASIVANKIKGIRAALCFNEYMGEMSKKHNNANVLVLGSRIIKPDLALKITQKWLSASFEGGRHQARIEKIMSLEKIS
jgi:ribose 5-phosphate isomerase B